MKKQINLKLDDITYNMLLIFQEKYGINKTAIIKLLIRSEYQKQFKIED